MTCERVRRQIGVYRELDRGERRALARHLSDCPDCRAAWQDEQRARALLSHVPLLDPPRTLESRLLAIPATAGTPSAPFRVAPLLAVAGLTVLLFGAGVWRTGGGTEMPTFADPQQPVVYPVIGPATAVARREAPADVGQRSRLAMLNAAPAEDAPQRMVLVAPARPLAQRSVVAAQAAGPAPAAVPPSAGAVAPTSGSTTGGHNATNSGGGNSGGGNSGGHSATTPRPTASPPPTPVPTACVDITVVAFADLAGGDTPDCPGCDGVWGEDDISAAAAAGLELPEWQVGIFNDSTGVVIKEGNLTIDGGRGTYHITECGLELPVRVQLKPDAGWATCANSGGLDRLVTTSDTTTVTFPVTLGCPIATPPADVTPTAALPPVDPLATTETPTPAAPLATELPQP